MQEAVKAVKTKHIGVVFTHVDTVRLQETNESWNMGHAKAYIQKVFKFVPGLDAPTEDRIFNFAGLEGNGWPVT